MSDEQETPLIKIPINTNITIGTYTYRHLEEPKLHDRETDVYYKTKERLPNSNVAIPTYDAVLEAKLWVDDENKK